MDIKKIAKTSAKITGVFLFWVLLFTFVGILLNWTFFGIASWKLYTELRASLSGYWFLIPFVLLAALFLIALPIFYFLAGKLYAVQKVVAALFRKQRSFLFDYFALKLKENPWLLEKIQMPDHKTHALLKKIGDMPWALRFLFGFVDERIELLTAAGRLYGGMEPGKFDPDWFSAQMNEDLGPKIEEHLLNPTFRPLAIVMTLDFASMTLLVFWLFS